MSIERPNLAAAFKPATQDRASGLMGLLPPATPPARHDETAAKTKDAEKPVQKADAAPDVTPVKTTRRAVAAKPEHAGVGNVAVYLEPDLLAIVRAAKRRDLAPGEPDFTYDDLLVQALTAIPANRLAALFADATPVGTGSPLQPRARRRRGIEGIQIQLRLDGAQRGALDELVLKTGAPSRTALVAGAYRLHFSNN